ncbi:type II toxin-antitoxin system RelB/DinJ family antitoxin [Candidatus Parcubacteria bacterium]|nr:type II toxin-antitoxin system RelB/DinJ family antitoxin [Candidatus Parcubacteria bacterium]
MKTAVINIKTDIKTKNQARKVAEELGFSLSSLANAYFKTLIKTKEVHFSVNPKEEPSDYMIQALKEAEADKKISPTFDNARDATAWLKDKNRKYEDKI